MKNRDVILLSLFLFLAFDFVAFAVTGLPDAKLLAYLRDKSEIREGGSGLFNYKDENYVVTVTSLVVGNKSEQACKTTGSAKAKRDMLAYINGSDVSSYTELKTSETVSETLEGEKVEAKQEYIEVIKERVLGTINQCVQLGGYYSDDRSIYYFVIYKIL